MIVFVCNAGSTSLKFKLYDMPQEIVMARGTIERIGSHDDAIFQYDNGKGYIVKLAKLKIPDYKSGIELFLDHLISPETGVLSSVSEIKRIGFKTVLSKGHLYVHELTSETIKGMRDWIKLAPVHNKAYIEAVDALRQVLPDSMFVGCFETGFHRTIPIERRIYGIPYEWYETYGIQRLGYHGASHEYIAGVLNELSSGKPYKAISCHLGGSASICAIQDGKSVDTSFGMSLQTGLVHSTRCGDMDCDLFEFLESLGLSGQEIHEGISKKGGLLGISGVSGDLRYVEKAAEEGNERAKLAMDVFVTGIVRYIGSFYLELGGLDYLVFTAGIGQHSSCVRKRVCEKLKVLGICLDEHANETCEGQKVISNAGSSAQVMVIPTDEERGIARKTYEYGGQKV